MKSKAQTMAKKEKALDHIQTLSRSSYFIFSLFKIYFSSKNKKLNSANKKKCKF